MEDWRAIQSRAAEEEARKARERAEEKPFDIFDNEVTRRVKVEREAKRKEQDYKFRLHALGLLRDIGAVGMLQGIKEQVWKDGDIVELTYEGERNRRVDTVSRFGVAQNSRVVSDRQSKYLLKALRFKGRKQYIHLAVGVAGTFNFSEDVGYYTEGNGQLLVQSVTSPVEIPLSEVYKRAQGSPMVSESRFSMDNTPGVRRDIQNSLALDCSRREASKQLPGNLNRRLF